MKSLKKPLFKLLTEMKTPDGISYLDNIIYTLSNNGLSNIEIAKLLELSETTIRKRLLRVERQKVSVVKQTDARQNSA